jgi:hypothetical protein
MCAVLTIISRVVGTWQNHFLNASQICVLCKVKRSNLMLEMKFLYSIWIEHQNQSRAHSSQMLIQRAKSLFKDWKCSWSRVHKSIKVLKPVKVGLNSMKLKIATFTLPHCKGRQLMETLLQQSYSRKNFHVCLFHLVWYCLFCRLQLKWYTLNVRWYMCSART